MICIIYMTYDDFNLKNLIVWRPSRWGRSPGEPARGPACFGRWPCRSLPGRPRSSPASKRNKWREFLWKIIRNDEKLNEIHLNSMKFHENHLKSSLRISFLTQKTRRDPMPRRARTESRLGDMELTEVEPRRTLFKNFFLNALLSLLN